MTDENLTAEDKEAIYDYLAGSPSAPVPEEKFNVHTFLHRVATADDTTKVGFLTEDELGVPKHPERSLKEFSIISDRIIGNTYFRDYFNAEAEQVITAPSLSKLGFLVKQATTQTKQVADVTKPKVQNKGWFKKKEPKEGDSIQ